MFSNGTKRRTRKLSDRPVHFDPLRGPQIGQRDAYKARMQPKKTKKSRAGNERTIVIAASVVGIFAVGLFAGSLVGLYAGPESAKAAATQTAGGKGTVKAGPRANYLPPEFLSIKPSKVQTEPAEEMAAARPLLDRRAEPADGAVRGIVPIPHPKPAAAPPTHPTVATETYPEEEPLDFDALARRKRELASLPALSMPTYQGDGVPPWRANAMTVKIDPGKPMIAIVIDDLGLDRPHTRQVLDLPGPITAAFLSYAGDLKNQTAYAHQHGHELMIHVPMEPLRSSIDPGPNVLRKGYDAAKIKTLLQRSFDSFDGYVGINNHMGSKFTADPDGMAVVLAELKKRGLLFLDSRTSNASVGAEIADMYGVPNVTRHVFLDNEPDETYVMGQLYELEGWAKRQGFAVGIGHPHAWTIRALKKWMPTLAAKGYQLVPISAVVRERSKVASAALDR